MDNSISNVAKAVQGQKKNKFKASVKPAQNNQQAACGTVPQSQGQQAQQSKPQGS